MERYVAVMMVGGREGGRDRGLRDHLSKYY